MTFNPRARAQFEAFHRRRDTFSLGVCNGCQLMALLGWVGGESPTSDPPGEWGWGEGPVGGLEGLGRCLGGGV